MNVLDWKIARIATEADDLLSTINLLERLTTELTTPQYELRRAANSMREAASKLEKICERT